jgi:hypothetical protein
MRQVMIRYTVHPDRAQENAALVRAVYAELAETRPAGLRYATLRLADGVSFVHIAVHTTDGQNPLDGVAAFAAFQAGVADRVQAPPVVTEWEEVGSYHFFDGDAHAAAP